MASESSQAKLSLALLLLVVILILLWQTLFSDSGWKRSNLDDLVAEVQSAVHDCIEDNQEVFDRIAGTDGKIRPSSLRFVPGFYDFGSALQKSVEYTLGPEVEALLSPKVGRNRALEAVVGSYLIAGEDKSNFRIEPHLSDDNLFEVFWPKIPGDLPSFSVTLRAEFNDAEQLVEIALLSVSPLKV